MLLWRSHARRTLYSIPSCVNMWNYAAFFMLVRCPPFIYTFTIALIHFMLSLFFFKLVFFIVFFYFFILFRCYPFFRIPLPVSLSTLIPTMLPGNFYNMNAGWNLIKAKFCYKMKFAGQITQASSLSLVQVGSTYYSFLTKHNHV